jgi:hypothetical protein
MRMSRQEQITQELAAIVRGIQRKGSMTDIDFTNFEECLLATKINKSEIETVQRHLKVLSQQVQN